MYKNIQQGPILLWCQYLVGWEATYLKEKGCKSLFLMTFILLFSMLHINIFKLLKASLIL